MMTPSEVAERTFHTTRFNSGYKTEDVDNFMDQITEDYTALYKENAVLKSKMKVLADKISEYRATEDDMRTTLLVARKKADTIIAEAEQEHQRMLKDAEAEVIERRRELRQGIADSEAQLTAAKQSTAQFVEKMRALVESQNLFLENLGTVHAEDVPADPVSETAAAIDESLDAILPDSELAERLRSAEEAAEAAPEAAYQQEVPDVTDDPTRVIEFGNKAADQDYQM